MEELLVKSGVQGIRSHMVLPPRTELMEGELKQRIKEADYDAVLVIRPKAFRKETQEVGTKSVYMPPPFYKIFGHIGTWPSSSSPRRVLISRKTPWSSPSLIFTTPRMKPFCGVEKRTPFIPKTLRNWAKSTPGHSSNN